MFETAAAALAVVVFLVPGFVWRTVEGQLVYLDKRLQWEKFALGLLARSTAIYGVFAAELYQEWRGNWLQEHPLKSTFVGICLIDIFPTVFGFLAGIIRQADLPGKVIRKLGFRTFVQHQIPTAWDYLFSTITPRWAIVTLKSGGKVYGFLGHSSYFSSEPESRDIFISQMLKPLEDGKFEGVANSAGIYIGKDEISLIEFIYSEL